MKLALPILLSFSLIAAMPAEEVDLSNHKDVYATINLLANTLPQATAKLSVEGDNIDLRGWKQEGKIVKILAQNAASGTTTEYYLEQGKPLFVYMVQKNANKSTAAAAKVEERLYFDNEEIVKWLNSDQNAPTLHGEDYQSMAESIHADVEAFQAALAKGAQIKGGKQSTVGTFLRVDEGDYMHWVMKCTNGEELSLFILDGNDELDAVLAAPDKFVGKSCTVTWTTSTEDIPESGGKMELQKILSLEWKK